MNVTTGKILRGLAALALTALMAGCSSHRKAAKSTFTHAEEIRIEKEEVETLKGKQKRVLEEAFEWLDTPYEFGRQDKGVATDCSGMVMRVYEEAAGYKLPRNSAKQKEACREIGKHDVKPGDLVFFITNGGNRINHVGIMIDKEKFIHASTHGVRVSTMESDYYKKHFKGFARPACMD